MKNKEKKVEMRQNPMPTSCFLTSVVVAWVCSRCEKSLTYVHFCILCCVPKIAVPKSFYMSGTIFYSLFISSHI